MPTSYKTKGNEIYRNDELVAKVIEEKLVMEEGMEKFRTPCSKMVKKIIKDLANTAEPEEEETEPIEETTPEPEEEIAPPPEEDVVVTPTSDELVKELMKQNKFLMEQIASLQNGKNPPIDPRLVSPAITPRKKGQHNPFGWEPKPGVPPCPDGGEEGTKNAAVIEWAQTHYEEEAEDFYAVFYARQRFLASKAAEKARKKDYAFYK